MTFLEVYFIRYRLLLLSLVFSGYFIRLWSMFGLNLNYLQLANLIICLGTLPILLASHHGRIGLGFATQWSAVYLPPKCLHQISVHTWCLPSAVRLHCNIRSCICHSSFVHCRRSEVALPSICRGYLRFCHFGSCWVQWSERKCSDCACGAYNAC